jgi:hypothetical protein
MSMRRSHKVTRISGTHTIRISEVPSLAAPRMLHGLTAR